MTITTIRVALLMMSFNLALTHSLSAAEPPQILLWPDGAPGAQGSEDKDKPCIWLHQPPADKVEAGP